MPQLELQGSYDLQDLLARAKLPTLLGTEANLGRISDGDLRVGEVGAGVGGVDGTQRGCGRGCQGHRERRPGPGEWPEPTGLPRDSAGQRLLPSLASRAPRAFRPCSARPGWVCVPGQAVLQLLLQGGAPALLLRRLEPSVLGATLADQGREPDPAQRSKVAGGDGRARAGEAGAAGCPPCAWGLCAPGTQGISTALQVTNRVLFELKADEDVQPAGSAQQPSVPEALEVMLSSPFLFAIFEKDAGALHFLGHVDNPLNAV